MTYNHTKKQTDTDVQSQEQIWDHVKSDEFLGDYVEPPHRNVHVQKGDKVIMTKRYKVSNDHAGIIWTVTDNPRYINGTRRVKLKGLTEPYPVDGLQVVG